MKKGHWNDSKEYTVIHGSSSSDFAEEESEAMQKMWNKRAVEGNEKLPDRLQHKLELNSIIASVPKSSIILDAGCGSGYSSRSLNEKGFSVYGIDFAEDLIKKAQKESDSEISFQVADILNLPFSDSKFDVVLTQRVIQNLGNLENQFTAINEIFRVLKRGGKFLMLEQSKEGIANLNKIRTENDLDPIIVPWHNLPIDESLFFKKLEDNNWFKLSSIKDFSTYFLFSRVFHPLFVHPETPTYDSKINKIASVIQASDINISPSVSHVKLYIFEKL